jgi:hypothetical protein
MRSHSSRARSSHRLPAEPILLPRPSRPGRGKETRRRRTTRHRSRRYGRRVCLVGGGSRAWCSRSAGPRPLITAAHSTGVPCSPRWLCRYGIPRTGHCMQTVLIHHDDSILDREIVAPGIASFSELSGLLVIREPRSNQLRRVRRKLRRSGLFPLGRRGRISPLLVPATGEIRLSLGGARTYDPRQSTPPASQRHPEARDRRSEQLGDAPLQVERAPKLVIARCRVLLAPEIFSIPPLGTFVMHRGITPEYRNSRGCFWALNNRDLEQVGLSLVPIDERVDTGPVFGYFTYPYDERRVAVFGRFAIVRQCPHIEPWS